jgi:hypothetical protein
MSGRAGFTTAARIHGGNQLKARRIGDVMVGTGNDGLTGLERLTQRFQYARLELWEFVEKEYAMMGERHLTRLGAQATANESRRTCRMVGGPEGSAPGEPSASKLTGNGSDEAHLEHFGRL